MASRKFSTENPELVRLVLEEIDKVDKWAEQNQAEVVKITTPHLKIDEDIIAEMVKRRTYGLRAITPEIMAGQQQIADLFTQEKVIPKSIDVKEAMLTPEQYAAITPKTMISQK